MTIDSVIAPELLSAEIEAIEDLLVHYEDWRALTQLELRERQGEVPSNMAASGIKAMLIEKLASNPLFLRRQTLLKELERLTQSVHTPGQPITVRQRMYGGGDDLTRIRGIDTRLERRLNALNVRSFGQIASFTLDDVRYVSSTLGLENRIISQMWIEQAELLESSGQSTVQAPEPRFQPAPRPVTSVVAPVIQPAPAARDEPVPLKAATPPAAQALATTAPPPPAAPNDTPAPAPIKREPAVAQTAKVETAKVGPAKESPAVAAQQTAASKAELAKAVEVPAPREAPTAAAVAVVADKAEKANDENSKVVEVKAPASEIPAAPLAPVADPDYSRLVPPAPMAAMAFKSEYAEEPVQFPAPDYTALTPASPLAARKYTGAIFEPVDHGPLADAAPPPKPRPAATYAPLPPSVEEPPRLAQRPDVAVTLPLPARPDAAPPSALAAKLAAAPAAKEAISVEGNKRAAEIVGENLPALPLKPAGGAPQPPLSRHTAPPPASTSATTIQAAPKAPAPPLQPPPAVSAAAVAAREAAMLAAAAARTPAQVGAHRVPPPLPPAGNPRQVAPMPAPAPIQAPPAARSSAPPIDDSFRAGSDQRPSFGSNEARVTIKRSDEPASGPVLRSPGATEVHLGREQRRQSAQFDSASYAAYHSEVEEASVQIVRNKGGPAETQRANAVQAAQLQATQLQAALQAAQARAIQGHSAQLQPAQVPSAQVQSVQPSVAPPASLVAAVPMPSAKEAAPEAAIPGDKTSAPIGRFLRALTGQ